MMYSGVQHMKNSNTTTNSIWITRFLFWRLFSAFVLQEKKQGTRINAIKYVSRTRATYENQLKEKQTKDMINILRRNVINSVVEEMSYESEHKMGLALNHGFS